MNALRWIAVAAVIAASMSGSAQLGKGKGSGGGGGNPPASSPPPKNDPPPKPKENNPPPKPRENNPPPQSTPPPKPRENNPPSNGGSGGGQLGNVGSPNPRPQSGPASTRGGGSGNGSSGGGLSNSVENPGGKNGQVIGRSNRNTTRTSYQGSVNNQLGQSGGTRQAPVEPTRLPSDRQPGSLAGMVMREDNPRRGSSRYRQGYWHYDNDWRDDYFWYGNYVFDPYRHDRCAISPWYYYGHLPGYIQHGSIIIINNWSPGNFNGSFYHYVRPYSFDRYGSWGNSYRNELDESIDDLVIGFEQGDRRALGRVAPTRGRVDILLEGRYEYSLNADEFYQLLLDAALGTRTRRYDILSVSRYRDEVEVTARHDYYDPWGRVRSTYHWYRLEEDRRGYSITQFGTSDRRW